MAKLELEKARLQIDDFAAQAKAIADIMKAEAAEAGNPREAIALFMQQLQTEKDRQAQLLQQEKDLQAQREQAAMTAAGEVQCRTGPRSAPGSSAEVPTPTVLAFLGGSSSAAIRVAEQGASEFRLFEGRGEVTTPSGVQVELETAQALRVSAQGRLGPNLALPPPPVLQPARGGRRAARRLW